MEQAINELYQKASQIPKKFKIGDEVKVNNIEFYVIENSPRNQDYVVALKKDPLTVAEVQAYGIGHINNYTEDRIGKVTNVSGYGGIVYYSSETCGYINGKWNVPNCNISYNESDVKHVVDSWSNDKFQNNELKEVNNYKSRLINSQELLAVGYDNVPDNVNINVYRWVYNYNYWTFSSASPGSICVVHGNGNIAGRNANSSYDITVRPVVNVYKSALETQ